MGQAEGDRRHVTQWLSAVTHCRDRFVALTQLYPFLTIERSRNPETSDISSVNKTAFLTVNIRRAILKFAICAIMRMLPLLILQTLAYLSVLLDG